MRDYLEQLERFALAKTRYDDEHENDRFDVLEEFSEKEGWAGDFGKRKLREMASGKDNDPDLPDISRLISHD